MESILVAAIGQKGQVTLPQAIRRALRVRVGKDLVGFKLTPGGILVVPVEVRQKPLRLTPAEWKQLDRLRRRRGKTFHTARDLETYLKTL